jgi:hypothetical protein
MPEECDGSPLGKWKIVLYCGRGGAPIVREPPCHDSRLRTAGGFEVVGSFELTEDSRTTPGSQQHLWYYSYIPGVCFVSDDFVYECEVINAHADTRECSWSEVDSMCTCYRDWWEPANGETPVLGITDHTIATPLGDFEYCRSGDLLWLHLGPLQTDRRTREDFALLRAAD